MYGDFTESVRKLLNNSPVDEGGELEKIRGVANANQTNVAEIANIANTVVKLLSFLAHKGIIKNSTYNEILDANTQHNLSEYNPIDIAYCVMCKEVPDGGQIHPQTILKIVDRPLDNDPSGSNTTWEETKSKFREMLKKQGRDTWSINVAYIICHKCEAPNLENIIRGKVFAAEIGGTDQSNQDSCASSPA